MGWDISLFTPSQDIDAYGCTICQDVLRDPVSIGCLGDHCFCQECLLLLDSQSTCPLCRAGVRTDQRRPATFVKRLIDRLQVRCRADKSGECNWAGPLGDEHDRVCEAREVTCMNGTRRETCGWKGTSSSKPAHENVCALATVECSRPSCSAPLFRRDLVAHDNFCEGFRCPCYEDDGCPFVGRKAAWDVHATYCLRIHLDLRKLEARNEVLEDKASDLEARVEELEATLDQVGRTVEGPKETKARALRELYIGPFAVDGKDRSTDKVHLWPSSFPAPSAPPLPPQRPPAPTQRDPTPPAPRRKPLPPPRSRNPSTSPRSPSPPPPPPRFNLTSAGPEKPPPPPPPFNLSRPRPSAPFLPPMFDQSGRPNPLPTFDLSRSTTEARRGVEGGGAMARLARSSAPFDLTSMRKTGQGRRGREEEQAEEGSDEEGEDTLGRWEKTNAKRPRFDGAYPVEWEDAV